MTYDAATMDPGARTALDEAVDRVGDRWSLLLVDALLVGPRRFSELREVLPAIAPNVLSQRLRRLEEKGVLTTRLYSERPARRTYELTAEGRQLAGPIRLLADWGARAAPEADAIQHVACGTALEAHWYCPTCDRSVDEEEAPQLRFI